jgi:hypothetical protein
MKHIISFSLWGDNSKYTLGMVENVKLAKEIYPGWTVRIHYNDSVPSPIIKWLLDRGNVDLVRHEGKLHSFKNCFWRIEDIFSNDTVIVRDADSRLNIREKLAVEEWLSSDKDFHIMRDHPEHKCPVLAGMFGCRNNAYKYIVFANGNKNYNGCPCNFLDAKEQFDKHVNNLPPNEDAYMVDQRYLYRFVYPFVILNSMVHASYNKYEPFAKNFPECDYMGFVGEVHS